MNAYKTLTPVTFPSGTVLALDAKQAATRTHVLDDLRPGVYVAKQPLEFKAGEVIGLELPPSKGETGLELIEQQEAVGNESDPFAPLREVVLKPVKPGKK